VDKVMRNYRINRDRWTNEMANKNKYDIFISYAHYDEPSSHLVNALASELNERGIRTWIDNKDLKPDENLATQIKDAVDNSQVCLIVLTRASDSRKPWISMEWSTVQDSTWRRNDLKLCSLNVDKVRTPPFLRKWPSFDLEKRGDLKKIADQVQSWFSGRDPGKLATSDEEESAATAERFSTLRSIVDKSKSEANSKKSEDDSEDDNEPQS